MIGLDDEGGNSKLHDMLGALVFETNFFKRLQALEVIFNMVDDDLGGKIDLQSFIGFISQYIDDNEFMRNAKMISIIEENVETALEYYGRDYLTTPEFNFDEDFQGKRRIIDKQINNFIGRTLKELDVAEDFFS